MNARDEEALVLRNRIAQRFSKLRNDSGLTQAELAEEMGVSQNMIFRSEHDMNISTLTLLTLFLRYSGKKMVNPMWLFSFDNADFEPYITPIDLNRQTMEKHRKRIMEEMLQNLHTAGVIGDII